MNEKCKHCGKEFPREDIIISYNEFAYCPFCGVALFDLRSQNTNHWAWEYAPFKQKENLDFVRDLEKRCKMSSKMPEVGDVWESIFTGTKQYILYVGFMKSENINVVKLFDGDRCTLIEDKVLFSNYKYLGKSKAKINQLFEVQNG